MPFGVVSGVGQGKDELHGVHIPKGEGKVFCPIGLNDVFSVFLK